MVSVRLAMFVRPLVFATAAVLAVPHASLAAPGSLDGRAAQQIQALLQEKASRSPAQRKIDSGLLFAIRAARGERMAAGLDLPAPKGVVDAGGRVRVTVTAAVSDALVSRISALGATEVAAYRELGRFTATLDAQKVEALASMPEVGFVAAADDGVAAGAFGTPVSEGDKTHAAYAARHTYGYDGAGVRIGVISDSVDFLSRSQLSGNLGAVTVVPGQSGGARAGEGTAMLEIIHDIAPNAELFFATGTGDQPNMANNISILRNPPYSCDIIVDDWFYELEAPFQDGPIAQAVNAATAAGVVYVTAAQNDGNLDSAAAGTWEGDFNDGGALGALPGGTVHNFGPGVSDLVTQGSGYHYALFWSDPLGASSNDYDLFVLDGSLTNVLAFSTNTQSGSQNPEERVLSRYVTAGDRVVVFKHTGAANRFLHVKAFRGRLETATAGAIKGHAAAADALSTAATSAFGPYPNPFTSSAVVEAFSSDGPRRVFYQANGTAITPGNFSSTGGAVRTKPDITAADGIATSVPAFTAYYGTSAAASHAAGIAALVKSANPALSAAQVKNALVSTAIDMMAPGVDRDSGAGVIMANAAVGSLAPPAVANLSVSAVAFVEAPGANGNGGVEPGESGNVFITLTNGGAANATSVTGTLSLASPVAGVSVSAAGPRTFGSGTIAPNTSATNGTAFTIATDGTVACGQPLDLLLTVSFGNGASGASPLPLLVRVELRPSLLSITQTLDSVAPGSTAFYTGATGTQTGRLNPDERVATCENGKTSPGLATASGARRYDAYTLTNGSSTARCISVSLSSPCNASAGTELYLAAYTSAGFDPSNPSTNYLADAGILKLGNDETLSFNAAAATTYTLVVSEINPGATNSQACPYTLVVDSPTCRDLSGVHGDADASGQVTVQDVFYLINYLFAGGVPPLGFADANGDGITNVTDVFYLINYLYAGGTAPH